MKTQKITLGGGCFWGMEELFRKQPGVTDTEVGYAGGENENATYGNHPGHAEVVQITYNPAETDRDTLYDYFFKIHNPTTINQQGNDKGSSYRSVIFYTDDDERMEAKEAIERAGKSGRWEDPIVTSVEELTKYTRAEEEHQDYLQKHTGGYTCHFERQ